MLPLKEVYFYLFRVPSNLNLRVTFIWQNIINRFYMMENLQVALHLHITLRPLMRNYAWNHHQRKMLQFLFIPHML